MMSQFYEDETARGLEVRNLLDTYGVHLSAGVVGKNDIMDGHGQGKHTQASYSILGLNSPQAELSLCSKQPGISPP